MLLPPITDKPPAGELIDSCYIGVLDPSDELSLRFIDRLPYLDYGLYILVHSDGVNFAKRIWIVDAFNKDVHFEVNIKDEDVINTIRSSHLWEPGKPLLLISCNAGLYGTDSPAQRLADALETDVLAAAGYVYLDEEGHLYVSSEPIDEIEAISERDLAIQEHFWFPFYGMK